MADLIEPGVWFFTFDLRNGYYHVDIFEEHWKYLAFSFKFKAKTCYFMFCSLPFGLSSAPYVFTKLLRPVVAHWRSDGIRISVYLDDGIGADSTYSNSLKQSDRIRNDLDSLGFLVNEVKSDFEPHQFWDHLGFTLDLFKGEFSVSSQTTENLCY